MTLWIGALSILGGLSLSDLEGRAVKYVIKEFERVGRSAPVPDLHLQKAARELSRRALNSSATLAADVGAVTEEIAEAGGYDPGPRAIVVRGSPPDHAFESFASRTDLSQEPASHMGVAASVDGERAAIVAVFSQRKAELKAFQRTGLKKGASIRLCGELVPPLHTPAAYVTSPNGKVDSAPIRPDHGNRFCAEPRFPVNGRYWVELMSRGQKGPEVAALFPVDVGPKANSLPSRSAREGHSGGPGDASPTEPRTPADAQRAILERINSMRKIYGLSPLQSDPLLQSVAQVYSDRMARDNFFAHVAPDGSDLKTRLNRAGYTYQAAAENLGLAPGAIAAEFSIERSPGHRRNLIESAFTRVGIGVAFARRDERTLVLVTEVFANPARP